MLSLENVQAYYGSLHALKDVTLMLEEGKVGCLIGANGAGKTTTLMTISGLKQARGGRIMFRGTTIENLPPDRIVKLGISQVPEGRRIFPRLSVRENLTLGAYTRHDKEGIDADFDRVLEYFPKLSERLPQEGGTLSGGEQQMLAIGRALMARPRLLLLDEPSLGLAPLMVEKIFGIIAQIASDGMTVLLVEQNANAALQLADKGWVLETGRIVMQDKADNLLDNPDVRAAYLGEA